MFMSQTLTLEFPFKSQHPHKAEGALLDFCIHAVF